MSQDLLKTRFEQLSGRTVEPNEIRELYKVRDTLELDDDDPVWGIVMALQYHLMLYREIPLQIQASHAMTTEHLNTAYRTLAGELTKERQLLAKLLAADRDQRKRDYLMYSIGILLSGMFGIFLGKFF